MIIDKLTNISAYSNIEETIKNLHNFKSESASSLDAFETDKNHSVLFVIDEGFATFATSWREQEVNNEVISTLKIEEGYFILFLPGEPFIVKCDSSKVRKFILG